jgi:tetratricopeptide (TPR) repeat protein
MKRMLNIKLVGAVVGGFLLAGIGVHFLHAYQLSRNAHHLRDQGDRAAAEKNFGKAQYFYALYLNLAPSDADATKKYADLLDRRASSTSDRVRLVLLMEQVLRVQPNEHALRFRLVHNLVALDRIPEAISHLHKLTATGGDKAEVAHMIGWCHDASKDHAKAVSSFRDAIRWAPSRLQSYALLAEVLQERLHEPDEALKVMDEMARANPDAWQAYLERAQFHRRRGDDKSAWADLAKAQQLGPNQPHVLFAVETGFAARGDDAAAIKVLQDGQRRHPARIEFRMALCRLWSQRGRAMDLNQLANVNKDLPATVRAADRAQLDRALAEAWLHVGELDQAEAILVNVARAAPRDLASRARLIDIALEKKQLAAARGWLDDVRAIEGEYGTTWRLLEATLLINEARGDRGKLSAARQRLREVAAVQPNSAQAALGAAQISELEGKPSQAIGEYSRALESGDTRPVVLARLVTLLVQRREFSKAEAELTRFEQRAPLTPELCRLGAEVALGMREKRYTRVAVQRAEKAVGPRARDYRDMLWLADIYRAAGETAKSETLLRDTLTKVGPTPDVWIAWIDFLGRTDRREEALKEMQRMRGAHASGKLALTEARCYEALHMPAEADKAYRDVLAETPRDILALSFAADFWRRGDRLLDAEKAFQQLLDPLLAVPVESRRQARRHLAILVAARGATAQAHALLDENRAGDDNIADRRVRLFLASLAAARSNAVQHFEETLATHPGSPDDRLLFARMLEAAGQVEQARTHLAELVDEFPDEPRMLVRYARLLLRLEERGEARRLLARVDKLEPNSERVTELRKLLR